MILTIEELKQFIDTTIDDKVLEARLQALETLIRKYTNNNFQNKNIRYLCNALDNKIFLESDYLNVNDTIQVVNTMYNDGIYHIIKKENGFIELNKPLFAEVGLMIIKVDYPDDVKMGCINMLKWELDNRDKVGIQSETISRHSVTYFDMNGDNSIMGFPKSLLGFLKPYMKARF